MRKLLACTVVVAIAATAATTATSTTGNAYHPKQHYHPWKFPKTMTVLKRYRIIATHDGWWSSKRNLAYLNRSKAMTVPTINALYRFHMRELGHAKAHIRKIIAARRARQHTVPWWPWGAIVQCEAHGNWQYNGDDGDIFEGGPNFHPQTWSDYHTRVPTARQYAHAYDAPAWVQVKVAELVLAENGWGAWPDCSSRLGLR